MNISLTPELIKLVQSKVDSGYYNNSSEVIRDAIRRMDENEEILYQAKLERLKKALRPGIEAARRGEVSEYTYEQLMKDIEGEKNL